ncbi:hypothetical protein ABTE35_19270, partial [Acinetobacter baumannii]
IALMLVLITISLMRMHAISGAMRYQDQVTDTKLEPLYVAREALDQTGMLARNAYIFRDDADAARELAIVDEQKALYLSAVRQLE